MLEQFARLVQWACPHPRLRYVVDAWDCEYVCCFCDRRWFNEIPRLKGRIYRDGMWRSGK